MSKKVVLTNPYSTITLSSSKITDEDIQKLSQSRKIKKIRVLNLSHNLITANSIIFFSRQQWKNLIALNLWGNNIGAKGCKILSRAPLPSIQELDLRNNCIQSTGVTHLQKGQWRALRFLILRSIYVDQDGNFIGPNCINRLIRGNWKKLQQIGLNDNQLNFITLGSFSQIQFNKLKQICLYWNLLTKADKSMILGGIIKTKILMDLN